MFKYILYKIYLNIFYIFRHLVVKILGIISNNFYINKFYDNNFYIYKFLIISRNYFKFKLWIVIYFGNCSFTRR
jgi:hypothetical protein